MKRKKSMRDMLAWMTAATARLRAYNTP
jgi:hypothetical protein